MERRIDYGVIRKGYGKELLAFQKYHDRHYEPYDQTDGLTVKEIEEALRHCRSSSFRPQSGARSSTNSSLSSTRAKP